MRSQKSEIRRPGSGAKLFFGCLFGLTLLVAPLRADDKPVTETIKVPFETLKSKHIAVKVKVNGEGPFTLIFDTGAPTMLVNNKLAKKANLISKNSGSPFLGLGGQQVKIKSLEVGDAKVDNIPAVVMDHPLLDIMSKALGIPLDGIVGYPFWARYRMTIDYQAQEMTLVPVDYKPVDIMQTMMTTMMARMNGKGPPSILSPAAQWGFVAGKDSDDEDAGVVVREVLKDSAAAKAGLKKDDRVLSLDGHWTDTVLDLFEAAGPIKAGKTVSVKIKRDGKEMELSVTPASGL